MLELENKKVNAPLPDRVPPEVILKMSAQKLKEYMDQMALENPLIDIKDQTFLSRREQERYRKLEWLNQVDDSNRVYSELESDYIRSRDDWDVAPKNEKEDLFTSIMKIYLDSKEK